MTDAIQDGSDDASRDEKLDGIVEQLRADMSQGHVLDIADALRQRLSDAGISVSEAQIGALEKRLL